MLSRFVHKICMLAACGVICSTAQTASALTYVRLLEEPGHNATGTILGVPHGKAAKRSPADEARLQKVRKYNAAATRANHYMHQIEQIQHRLLQVRGYAQQQYNATHDASYLQAFRRDYQQGMQRIQQLSKLRNQELSYLANLVKRP